MGLNAAAFNEASWQEAGKSVLLKGDSGSSFASDRCQARRTLRTASTLPKPVASGACALARERPFGSWLRLARSFVDDDRGRAVYKKVHKRPRARSNEAWRRYGAKA